MHYGAETLLAAFGEQLERLPRFAGGGRFESICH